MYLLKVYRVFLNVCISIFQTVCIPFAVFYQAQLPPPPCNSIGFSHDSIPWLENYPLVLQAYKCDISRSKISNKTYEMGKIFVYRSLFSYQVLFFSHHIYVGATHRVCAYPSSKTAVAIYFVQLVIYFVQLATNCQPLSIQKHHSQRTFTYCCENEKGIFCIFFFFRTLCSE